jgi:hypothetical protein
LRLRLPPWQSSSHGLEEHYSSQQFDINAFGPLRAILSPAPRARHQYDVPLIQFEGRLTNSSAS